MTIGKSSLQDGECLRKKKAVITSFGKERAFELSTDLQLRSC